LKLGDVSPKRTVAMAVLGLIAVAVALGIGYPRAAAGVAVGACLGLVHYELLRRLIIRGTEPTPRSAQAVLFMRSVGRMVVSWLALVLAIPFGLETVFGVLVGVLLEIATYYGDVLLFILRRR